MSATSFRAVFALATCVFAAPTMAVMVYNNPTGYTTAPAPAEDAWRTVGSFNAASGVAIAPNYFITTQHQGGSISLDFELNGELYDVVPYSDQLNYYDIPNSDLRIWRTATAMPYYAPLFTGDPVGQSITIIGYGIHDLGEAVTTPDPAPNNHGWRWGTQKGKSWGLNEVDLVGFAGTFNVLAFDFDPSTDQGTLGDKDSGGGVFINDGGVWKLAGVNYGVQSLYSFEADGSPNFRAAIYAGAGSATELYVQGTTWVPAPGPQYAYAHNIAYYADAITQAIPEPAALGLVAGLGALMMRRRHAA